ncbi:MAG: ABC transporter permease [Phycisphaerae bacterium]
MNQELAAGQLEAEHLAADRRDGAIRLRDRGFLAGLGILGGSYVLLIVLLLLGDIAYMLQRTIAQAWESPQPWLALLAENPIVKAMGQPEIRHSVLLSLASCTLAAVVSVWIGVPMGYLLSRVKFRGRGAVDAILDIPIVLPPLVVGLSLLILFQFWPLTAQVGGRSLNSLVVYQVPAVVLAQVSVSAAFAVRTMKATFDQIDPRCEQVALALGCSRMQAFMRVVLPEARSGILTALTLAWARALGEFGPLLIFAGATRNKTEVLSTSVFLEMSIGNIEAAVAVSIIMLVAAVAVLMVTRLWGARRLSL